MIDVKRLERPEEQNSCTFVVTFNQDSPEAILRAAIARIEELVK